VFLTLTNINKYVFTLSTVQKKIGQCIWW